MIVNSNTYKGIVANSVLKSDNNTVINRTLNQYISYLGKGGTISRKSQTFLERGIRIRLESCKTKAIRLQCREGECFEQGSKPLWVKSKCYIRICPTCRKERIFRVEKKYKPYVKDLNMPRFITLTWKGKFSDLRKGKQSLDKAWQRLCERFLRPHYALRRYIKAFEFTQTDQEFQCHLHVIAESNYIPYTKLKSEWERLTSAWNVGIQKVYNRKQALKYLLKYITKGFDMSLDLGTYVSIYGLRFFNSVGFKDFHPMYDLYAVCEFCGQKLVYAGEADLTLEGEIHGVT